MFLHMTFIRMTWIMYRIQHWNLCVNVSGCVLHVHVSLCCSDNIFHSRNYSERCKCRSSSHVHSSGEFFRDYIKVATEFKSTFQLFFSRLLNINYISFVTHELYSGIYLKMPQKHIIISIVACTYIVYVICANNCDFQMPNFYHVLINHWIKLMFSEFSV